MRTIYILAIVFGLSAVSDSKIMAYSSKNTYIFDKANVDHQGLRNIIAKFNESAYGMSNYKCLTTWNISLDGNNLFFTLLAGSEEILKIKFDIEARQFAIKTRSILIGYAESSNIMQHLNLQFNDITIPAEFDNVRRRPIFHGLTLNSSMPIPMMLDALAKSISINYQFSNQQDNGPNAFQ
jgi:hypothetical protein